MLTRRGRIEQANHGILFLDEIGELDLNVQAKLLRFLQDGLVTPIGGKEKKVKIRLVAATHKDLAQEVADGNFREDLYYRLNEAVVTLPPLRERGDDILQLGNLFLAQMIETNDLDDMAFSAEAEKLLKEHSWPGNIRELRSTMRKVAILNDEAFISADFLSSQLGARNNTVKDHFPMNLNQAKKLLIKRQIEKALDLARGNRTQAAKLLDITPRSLFRFLSDKDYDIKVSDPENNVIQ
jgi:DNA-binding NtrC family response regulator